MRYIAAVSLAVLLGLGNHAFAQQAVATKSAAPTAIVNAVAAEPVNSVATPDASGKYRLRDGEDVSLQFS